MQAPARDASGRPEGRDDIRLLLGLLALAAVLRLGFVAAAAPTPWPDEQTYLIAAQDLLAGRPIGSDLVMPLYPAFVSLVGWERLPWVQALLSTATVALVWALAEQVFADRRIAAWAAALMAIEPLSVFYANQRLTETLFVFGLCAALLALWRRQLLLGSLLLVAGILVRPSIDLAAPLLVALFGWRQAAGRKALGAARGLALYALAYALLMAPWWLHNAEKYGRFVRLNLGDGIVMRLEQNPVFVEHGFWDRLQPVFDEFAEVSDPVRRNRLRREAALQFVREHPLRYLELSLRRLGRLWSPKLDQGEHWGLRLRVQLPFALATLAIYAGVALYAVQPRERKWARLAPLLLLLGYLSLVHVALHALVRYRAPLMPLVVVVAAAGWQRAAAGWLDRRRAGAGPA